ncbi:MAG: acyltransferase family protein [Pseudomonadota bacterium]
MIHSTKAARFHYLDHARGFVILLVVLQHAIQTYAQMWGGNWYFVPTEMDRSHAFDAIFFFTDGFIMQALFFISGMFVLPSLQKRGWLSFTWEKIVRLVFPFVFGVIFLVAPLSYAKYSLGNPGIGYFDYWFNIFFQQRLQAAGYWFLGYLVMFTFTAAIFYSVFPFVIRLLGALAAWMVRRPILGYLVFAGLSALMIGISDLIWGTPWWLGFGKLFYARANMLATYIFYFALGVGVRYAGVLSNKEVLQKMSVHWSKWVVLTAVLAVLYLSYCIFWMYDGAFSDEIVYHFAGGGTWVDVWPLMLDLGPGLLIRTTLHGFLCAAQSITLIVVLYRFTNKDIPFWTSLAACSYGIYFFHEPFVVWTQYYMLGSVLPAVIKACIAFIVGLGLSWLLTDKVLRKLPVTRRVF